MIRKDIIDLFRVPRDGKVRLKNYNPGWKQSVEFEDFGKDALKERLCASAASRSRALIFVSEAALEQFAVRYRRHPSWRVVRNGIDTETWSPGVGRLPRLPCHPSVACASAGSSAPRHEQLCCAPVAAAGSA